VESIEADMDALARTLRLLHRYVDGTPGELVSQVTITDQVTGQRARGPRQEAILALSDMANPAGLRPSVIAAQIDYSVPNTYNLLQSLGRKGLVELVPESQPQRWRLTSQHRHSATVFSQLVNTVRPGEWTTCADVSIASRGDTSAAWMVCWAAAKVGEFPGAHRVLLEGGIVHPSDNDHHRARPEQITASLVAEGLRFDARGRANPATRVAWDLLRARSHDPLRYS
jgi:DNA-binding transcriptional ArsR family regulator